MSLPVIHQHVVNFTSDHSVYGPIQSRRLGVTVGINPLGHENKICSYNCSYCELGETKVRMGQIERDVKFQKPEVINDQLRAELLKVDRDSMAIDSICVSGNGEPTLYPYFKELSEMIYGSRNELLRKPKIHLLTNGAHFDRKKVASALNFYDGSMSSLMQVMTKH